jgi:hypothetical protein
VAKAGSGTGGPRSWLEQVLDQLRPGDTPGRLEARPARPLAAPSGRHRHQPRLADRGIGFRNLQEAIDTITPGGKLVFYVSPASWPRGSLKV